jgi:hypothetical protein
VGLTEITFRGFPDNICRAVFLSFFMVVSIEDGHLRTPVPSICSQRKGSVRKTCFTSVIAGSFFNYG